MKRYRFPIWLAGAITLGLGGRAQANVRPNPLFSDGAVLQQGMKIPVWGTGDNGEKVTVELNGESASTTVRGGEWMVRLPRMKAGGPYEMTIRAANTIPVHNVLIGEVWICSGQSNMQFGLDTAIGGPEAIASSRDPMLRLMTVNRIATDDPLKEVAVSWKEAGPETTRGFTAVGYYFGRDLRKSLGVPVGLINTNYGGTPAEAWTSREALEANPELRSILDRYNQSVRTYPLQRAQFDIALSQNPPKPGAQAPRPPVDPRQNPQRPTGLYNAMIAPLIPYAIRGAIWYQGESNAGQAYQYQTLFPTMIKDWRDRWGEGNFPFYFVQLAPFMAIQQEPRDSAWAELREAQRLTVERLPNTGMAVITDVGDERDIHPRRKEPVGQRLALLALREVYDKDLEAYGPEYAGMSVSGNRAVLRFKHGEGLKAEGGSLNGFTIAGSDGKWHNAQAEIHGDRVEVWSAQVGHPVAVRYGWADYPLGNLWNAAGLPASPFRTDDFPLSTQPKSQGSR